MQTLAVLGQGDHSTGEAVNVDEVNGGDVHACGTEGDGHQGWCRHYRRCAKWTLASGSQGLTSCRPEPSSRRHVNKEAYGLSSVHLKL